MMKTEKRLNPKALEQVVKAKRPGMYHDGRGLYLHIGPTGGMSWLFRYQIAGQPRHMGLGGYPDIGVAKARELLAKVREAKAQGIDPLAERQQKREEAKAVAAKTITFKACAAKYITANRAGWKNAKHAGQWESTLEAYVYPTIGSLAVGAIETGHITKILGAIWASKTETAGRVRGRVESILDYATTHGWRIGPNPACWKGHLQNVLPKRSKVAKVEHHPALPWKEIGAFMTTLAKQEGVAAIALRFAILTAARTGEVIGARWAEIDMKERLWVLPSERMKGAREHRVPLSDAAIDVLHDIKKLGIEDYVFPGQKAGKPMSNMALLMTLRRLGRDDITAHGFRSTFRDWAAETGKPADVSEAALAHAIEDKTEAAYQRGDLLDRRRRLMGQWAEFCSQPAPAEDDTVISMHRATA